MRTATKAPPAPVESKWSNDDLIQREIDREGLRQASFERRKDRLVNEIPDLANPWLYMNSDDLRAFQMMGLSNSLEIAQELAVHQMIREARAVAGDPAILEAALLEEAAAIEAEQMTRAEVDDLDAAVDGEPAIARTIVKLQKQLSGLTATRIAASNKVAAIRGKLSFLRNNAPKAMRDDVEKELSRAKLSSAVYRRFCELRGKVKDFEKLIAHWELRELWAKESGNSMSHYCTRDDYLCVIAREQLPAAYEPNKGVPSINVEAFGRYVAELKSTTLPQLIAERDKLQAEWQKTVDAINANLDHWVRTGEVLS